MVYDLFDVLLYFAEDFSIYVHQRYWPIIFFVVSLSGFGFRILLACKMSLGAFPPLEFYEIVGEGVVLVLLRMFGRIHLRSIWSRAFFGGEFFDYCFNFIRYNLSIQIL